ncbi:MAG TPA: LD-carboxypeptidase [Gemmatimonadales bacterium]|nr:LD-carboxypeptidase [Gemmatimonadales bacterium]
MAPAGPLLEGDDITRAQALCRALGYEPVLAPAAGGRHGYLAGPDEDRLADLNAALRDPAIDAVWCLRGGYGSTRILDRVDFAALARRPKPLIGFSDVTALLSGALARAGVVAFHGPVARASMPAFSRHHFERVLACAEPAGRLGRLPEPPDVLIPRADRIVTLAGGVAEGPLVGGNLTLLQCLVGTPFLPDLDGAVLFLEDVGEDLYRVDRMLAHLRMAGALDRLAGVAIGRFTELKRHMSDGALGFEDVLRTYFGPAGIPVAYGFPVGHIDDQWTLPLGVRARLDAGAGEVELLEAAVA